MESEGSRVRYSVRSCPDCGYQFGVVTCGRVFPDRRRQYVEPVGVLLDHAGRFPVDECPGCHRLSAIGNTVKGVRTEGEAVAQFLAKSR
jgi:hypothetical protein